MRIKRKKTFFKKKRRKLMGIENPINIPVIREVSPNRL